MAPVVPGGYWKYAPVPEGTMPFASDAARSAPPATACTSAKRGRPPLAVSTDARYRVDDTHGMLGWSHATNASCLPSGRQHGCA